MEMMTSYFSWILATVAGSGSASSRKSNVSINGKDPLTKKMKKFNCDLHQVNKAHTMTMSLAWRTPSSDPRMETVFLRSGGMCGSVKSGNMMVVPVTERMCCRFIFPAPCTTAWCCGEISSVMHTCTWFFTKQSSNQQGHSRKSSWTSAHLALVEHRQIPREQKNQKLTANDPQKKSTRILTASFRGNTSDSLPLMTTTPGRGPRDLARNETCTV